VVTSQTGAAIRDIIRVLSQRNPKISILVLPALVQGEEAALSIATRINQANAWNLVDVLIVGRGGGSIEDLLPFSEEIVVRAIAHSHIPVISAVGHETDWALSDYAADLRAPTPSSAAEMACSDLSLIEKEIDHFKAILAQSIKHVVVQAQQRLFSASPRSLEDVLVKQQLQLSQRFDSALDFLSHSMQQKQEQAYNRVVLAANSIEISNPHEIMKRGFSIVRKNRTPVDDAHKPMAIVKNSSVLQSGDLIQILFYKGEAEAIIDNIMPEKKRSQ
jgi:exodeoxyribonuclease VII large subunit